MAGELPEPPKPDFPEPSGGVNRPDFSKDQPPKGKTEAYYPHPSGQSNFMPGDEQLIMQQPEEMPGGLDTTGQYIPFAQGEDVTSNEHERKVKEAQDQDT